MNTEVWKVLQSVVDRPTTASYLQAARRIRSLNKEMHPVRISLLSTFTIDPYVPYFEVEAARKGFAVDIYVGPFNAVRQELLNPKSGCLNHNPDIIFVAQLLTDTCPPIINDFLGLDTNQVEGYIDEIIFDTLTILKEFRKSSRAAIIIHSFSIAPYPLFGIHEVMMSGNQSEIIRSLNARLVDAANELSGVYVLDYERLIREVGYRNWHDEKMWYLARAPLSAQAMPVLAKEHAAFVQAIHGSPRKCLVLDLDNTLWGGIIGEDGLASIKLGHGYPGNAFVDFQRSILQLHKRGVLLAINSKNNMTDVEEVFWAHPDMVLKMEDFSTVCINWREKPENMVEIAEELNIGIDSMVFFDDNPAERALMRQVFPQILTIEVPNDILKYTQALLDSRAFDKLSFTDEDHRRGEMYLADKSRLKLKRKANSLEDFYTSLEMVADISVVNEFSFPRAVDLIQKTNQFNLTTRRHSVAKIKEMMDDPNMGVFTLQVKDRFGDSGIVGLAIVQLRKNYVYIDTFLLSCRILGRTVETAFLSFLEDWARSRDAIALEGEYIPTSKNIPAADFYTRHGFVKVNVNDNLNLWRLDLEKAPFKWPEYIQLAGRLKEK